MHHSASFCMLTAVIHWNKSDRLTPITAHIGMNSICFRFLNVFFPPPAHAKTYFPPVFRKNGCLSPPEVSGHRTYDLRRIRFICVPQAGMFPGTPQTAPERQQENLLKLQLQEVFRFGPKQTSVPLPLL